MATNRLETIESDSEHSAIADVRARFTSSEREIRQEVKEGSRLPAIAIPFFLIITAAVASVFYIHAVHVARQRALYAQYISENAAWRAPVQRQYAKVSGYLDEFERIDPTKPLNWAALRKDADDFGIEQGKLRGLRVNSSRSSNNVLAKADSMLDAYNSVYDLSELPQWIHDEKLNAAQAQATAVDWVNRAWFIQWRYQLDSPYYNIERQRRLKETRGMSLDQLNGYLFANARQLRSIAMTDRKNFETALQTEQDVPAGLDLEYAKGLR